MIRLVRSLVLTSLLLSLPMSASALGISITGVSSSGASTTLLAPGDILTVDLVAENLGAVALSGLGLVATGYDDDRNGIADTGLALNGGLVTPGLFNTFRSPGDPNQAFGGLDNIRTAPVEQWFYDVFDPQELRASFFSGATIGVPATGTGADDVGIAGNYTGDGDIHFQLSFIAGATPGISAEVFTLNFGTNAEYGETAITPGGGTTAFGNASLVVTVIPEPGTALLMGLGLAGLATVRRR